MASALDESLKHPSHGSKPNLVVSVLSATQDNLAARFARADAGASPFDGLPDDPPVTAEDVPYLADCVGALSCMLVSPAWPLHDLDALARFAQPTEPWEGDGVASQLYIARVVRVEYAAKPGKDGQLPLPLVYHRRAYATVAPLASTPQNKS